VTLNIDFDSVHENYVSLKSDKNFKTYVTGQIWANPGKLQNVSEDNY